MTDRSDDALALLAAKLDTIAALLARAVPPAAIAPDFASAEAFVWAGTAARLAPVTRVNRVDIALLQGIDLVRDQLVGNTERFARGLPANNALLWGARGMGKSSLVKAAHASVAARMAAEGRPALKLVEIHREDIETLPQLLSLLAPTAHRFVVFCDDLSFDAGDASYKSLKAVLEGGVEGRPENVLFYATSNRRHLMPEYFSENLETTRVDGEIHPGEAIEEKISLSERFGLWISFYPFDQDSYLHIVAHWLKSYGFSKKAIAAAEREALNWALGRGSRSGRVAWQFARDYAGRAGVRP